MATRCLIPLLGKMLRVTELDSCGAPLTDGEYIATDGFVSITLSSEIEDGTEIIVRKANGSLCVNEKMADSFKRFTVELHLCGVNPSLLGIMSNANPYYDTEGGDGDIIGFTVPEGEIQKWFALELWTGLSGNVCEPGAEDASGYILLPFVTAGTLGDLEITGEDAIDFSITGAATKGGNQWGVGPYDITSTGPLPVPIDAFDHLLMIETDLALPPSSCDPVPIPDVATFREALEQAADNLSKIDTGDITPNAGAATGATAGSPGTWTPAGSTPPADESGMDDIVAKPKTKWADGQYVETGDGQAFTWAGGAWAVTDVAVLAN